ncbi:MAG: LCP family protein [Actinomycetota bacterium]|nr:LCP family protein [Actinomycetota bacterium]
MKRRVRTMAIAAPIVLVVLIAALVRIGHNSNNGSTSSIGAGPKPVTYLVMTVRAGDVSRQADTMTVFSIGGKATPYALLIPTTTLTEIPGYGFDSIGRALSFGRVPLADVTVENMLGVHVDHVAIIDDVAFARFIDGIGGVTISVPSNLFQSNGRGTLVPVFGAGTQSMRGGRAVRYLTFQAPDETELSRLAREQQLWNGIFAKFAGSKASDLADRVRDIGNAVDGDAGATAFGRYLAAFAQLAQSARTYDVLPVTPVGGSGVEEAFRVNQDELDVQVSRFLGGSMASKKARPRLQLLNGNGTPEVGVSVAQKLIPQGLRLVDSGNARSFDFAVTKIIVYADDPEALALAEHIKQLLGAGEIEVARRPQTSIDVTVVIGKDYRAA